MTMEKSAGEKELYNHDGVIHCYHYNCFLQRTIQDPEYLDTVPMLKTAAAHVALSHMRMLMAAAPPADKGAALQMASELCRHRGFGILDLSGVTAAGGRVVSTMSHYGFGWLKKFGKNREPVCHFLAGYLRGVLTATFNKEYTVSETLCLAKGDGRCVFEVYEGSADSLLDVHDNGPKIIDVVSPPASLAGNLDIESITKAVIGLGLAGNEDGMIDAFDVYLTRHYSDYYNRISFGFEKLLEEVSSVEGLAQPLLSEAGHVCGFNTFGGIMKSPEWYALVVPGAKNRMDWVHGMVAVINALGWGTWRIVELQDNKRLVVRIYNSYEAKGYREQFGLAKGPKCYMAQGTSASIMNLIYLGNIEEKPDLTELFYERLFSGEDSFYSIETKCLAKGDEYCEFVVERIEE